jgi:hypothetical protein
VAGDGGGALISLTGSATATNWTVANNQVTGMSGAAAFAGGLGVAAGSLTLNHATVAANSAAGNV